MVVIPGFAMLELFPLFPWFDVLFAAPPAPTVIVYGPGLNSPKGVSEDEHAPEVSQLNEFL
jgi:hypothetical protein|tara:strand:+ start:424 stop:606 length:183 start_codon:yes stop_codon:yes gene_type:complete